VERGDGDGVGRHGAREARGELGREGGVAVKVACVAHGLLRGAQRERHAHVDASRAHERGVEALLPTRGLDRTSQLDSGSRVHTQGWSCRFTLGLLRSATDPPRLLGRRGPGTPRAPPHSSDKGLEPESRARDGWLSGRALRGRCVPVASEYVHVYVYVCVFNVE
jgi:hypothetical protein